MIRSSVRRRHSLSIAVGATTSAVAFAAISGVAIAATPKPAPTAGGNASCAPSAGVTPTTVTLGWIGPKTGPGAASFVGSAEAAQLRVDQENAKGGVNGRKLILKIYDDATNPNSQISAATKALQQDDVFGLASTTTIAAMFPTLKDQGIPVTGFTLPAFGTDRNAFGVTGATISGNPALASTSVLDALKAQGVTKVAVMNHVSIAGAAAANGLAALIPSVPGLTMVLRIADSAQGTHDATSEALRIKQSGADGLTFNGFVDGAVSIAQALKQQGVSLKSMYIAGLSDPANLKSAGGALDGALGTNYGTVPVGVNNRAVKTFASGMKAAGLNPYSPAAPIGFLTADLLIKGLKVAGKCPTRASFINNLRNVTNYDGGGLLPAKVSFKPGIEPNGDPSLCTWYMIAKGADLVPAPKADCSAKIIDTSTGKVLLGG